jgi:hypothetical protein
MRIFLLLLLAISFELSQAQATITGYNGNPETDIPLIFDQKEFNGKLAVMALEVDEYDYYVVDMTRFASPAERAYFLNLAYSESRIVSIDGAIDHDQLWFKAYHKYTENEVLCLFDELKEKSSAACSSMTAEEQSSWIRKFEKTQK